MLNKKLLLTIALAIAPVAFAMEQSKPRELPKAVKPYTIAQLVHDLRAKKKLHEIMFEDPEALGSSVINLDGRGLTDLTGLSLVLPDHRKKTVWKISAKNNYITKIPASDLATYKDLEVVELPNNQITSLGTQEEPISFARICPSCTWIDLSQNRITLVPAPAFARMRELTHLNLKKNRIKIIEYKSFSGLLNLTGLSLESNHLRDIPGDLFRDLHQLESLRLSNNYLDSKEDFIFPSRARVTFEPQNTEPAAPILDKLNPAILQSNSIPQIIQFLLVMNQDVRKSLFDQASPAAKEKIKQALKIITLIDLIQKTDDIVALKNILQRLTPPEQDLLFETAPKDVQTKLTIILFELSGQKGQWAGQAPFEEESETSADEESEASADECEDE